MADNKVEYDEITSETVDETQSYLEYTKELAIESFRGEYPLNVIYEGIEKQFQDYINNEDETSYVDIFCQQWTDSMKYLDDTADDNSDDVQFMKDYLNDTLDNFYQKLEELFEQRLAISIPAIEEDSGADNDDVMPMLIQIYEFFVLHAKDNFKKVIAKDAVARLYELKNENPEVLNTEESISDTLSSLVSDYSPLITTIEPIRFLELCGNEEIMEYFQNGVFTGNFLRKYSPKFYRNELFQISVTAEATLIYQLREEVFNHE